MQGGDGGEGLLNLTTGVLIRDGRTQGSTCWKGAEVEFMPPGAQECLGPLKARRHKKVFFLRDFRGSSVLSVIRFWTFNLQPSVRIINFCLFTFQETQFVMFCYSIPRKKKI